MVSFNFHSIKEKLERKGDKTEELWIKRGSKSRLICFLLCLLFPPIGYYFSGKEWRGLFVMLVTNGFITFFSLFGGVFSLFSMIGVYVFFWYDLGMIFKENDLIPSTDFSPTAFDTNR